MGFGNADTTVGHGMDCSSLARIRDRPTSLQDALEGVERFGANFSSSLSWVRIVKAGVMIPVILRVKLSEYPVSNGVCILYLLMDSTD